MDKLKFLLAQVVYYIIICMVLYAFVYFAFGDLFMFFITY